MRAFVRRGVKSDLARNGALVLGAVLAANVFNYAYYLLMGRSLSVRDYGTVMSLVSIVLFTMGVGTIGQTVVAKVVADLRAAGASERVAAFARSVQMVSIIVAGAIFVVVFLGRAGIASFLHIREAQLVTVAGAAAAFGFVLPVQRGIFQGEAAFATFGVSSSLDGFVKALLLLPLARLYGALGALGAMALATMASATFGFIAMAKRFGDTSSVARLDAKRLFITAGATGISALGVTVLMFYDVILAKHFLSASEAGLYGAAALAGRSLFTIVSFVPTVLLPDVARRSAHGRSDRAVLGAALAVSGGIVLAIALACGLAPRFVLRALAGGNFAGAATLVLPYVAASGALAIGNVLAMYAIARHRFGFVPYLLAIAAAEIVLVSVRHGSASQIVQAVFLGHATVAAVMSAWLAIDPFRRDVKAFAAADRLDDLGRSREKPRA